MLVCVCQGISCRDVDEAMREGAANVKDLKRALNLGTCCGQCVPFTRDLLEEKLLANTHSMPFHLAQELRA